MESDTRLQLLNTATPLFALKGLNGVSIRQLADAAGVNSALISYHFGGKDGLYAAVLENQFSTIAETLANLPPPPTTMTPHLSFYAKTVLASHRRQPYLIRFLHSELTNPTACFDSVMKKYIRRFYAFLHTALSAGISNGEFKADLNPAYAALALVGSLNFYFIAKPLTAAFLPTDQDHDAQYVEQALNIYLTGIRG